jgi:hypothetical protein
MLWECDGVMFCFDRVRYDYALLFASGWWLGLFGEMIDDMVFIIDDDDDTKSKRIMQYNGWDYTLSVEQ